MELVPVLPRRPLWADRQLIAAADLTAEQSWQDAQLARLRRYTLGWGVVAGLDVTLQASNGLQIERGYAISPLGNETYLHSPLTLPDVLPALLAACQPAYCATCDDPAMASDLIDEVEHEAWLVLRPNTITSCPRPTLPQGCENAGNTWALSRQSGALRLEILCSLPTGLLPEARDCKAVQALLTAGVVPMPPELEDIIPLARLRYMVGGLTAVSTAERRRLLPLSELHAALACCDCTPAAEPAPKDPWTQPFGPKIRDLFEAYDGFFPHRATDETLLVSSLFDPSTMALNPVNTRVLQAFAAAALVTQAKHLRDWEAGNYLAVYRTALEDQTTLPIFEAAHLPPDALAPDTRAADAPAPDTRASDAPAFDAPAFDAPTMRATSLPPEATAIAAAISAAPHALATTPSATAAAATTLAAAATATTAAAATGIGIAPPSGPNAPLLHYTLADLARISPAIAAFRLAYDGELVSDLDQILREARATADGNPGAKAVLFATQQRLTQLVQG